MKPAALVIVSPKRSNSCTSPWAAVAKLQKSATITMPQRTPILSIKRPIKIEPTAYAIWNAAMMFE